MVFFHHSIAAASLSATSGLEKLLGSLFGAGWIGVDLFFALSGYLITGILLDSKGESGYFWKFYAKRTLRIFPLYYLFLILLFLLFTPAVEKIYAPNPAFLQLEKAQWWFWTYLQNWYFVHLGAGSIVPVTQLWSLAVEEQFYLIWPLVVFVSSARRTVYIAAAVCAMAPFVRLAFIWAGWSETAVYMATVTRIDALLVGGLLAAWLRSGFRVPSARTGALIASIVFPSGLALAALLDHGFRRAGVAMQTIGFSVISCSAAMLIFVAVANNASSLLNRLLSLQAARSVGKYSYAFYIFHPPVLWGLAALMRSRGGLPGSDAHFLTIDYFVFLALALAITYALSWLSYHLFERHFLALKRYFNATPRVVPSPGIEPG